MPMTETLAERVAQLRREKAARERRDISQKEVAREIGVSNPVISETESGKTYPSDATLGKLARYFGVTERYLEYGDGDSKHTRATLERLTRDVEHPAVPVEKRKAPAKKASAKKGTGRKAG